jgi:hypothetical protein
MKIITKLEPKFDSSSDLGKESNEKMGGRNKSLARPGRKFQGRRMWERGARRGETRNPLDLINL